VKEHSISVLPRIDSRVVAFGLGRIPLEKLLVDGRQVVMSMESSVSRLSPESLKCIVRVMRHEQGMQIWLISR